MNNGKICVSVCAETSDEFIENINRATEIADVVELRFDCLEKNELQDALLKVKNLEISKFLLATFRPQEQGGKRELTFTERVKFWESFFWNNNLENLYADFEFDLKSIFNLKSTKSIFSFHDFAGVPDNLATIYNTGKTLTNADILKIAVQADDISDSLAVWNLLEKSKTDKKQIVPIAMGEAGKWTRILGLAHGAPLTYAALDAGNETAPGQITARDMIDVYRVKKLNEQTEVYGIVGNPVAHSLSPFMHNAAFRFHKLNCVYIPFEVKNLDEFVKRFARPETREIEWNLKGFSVTIPHKQAIIKYLDSSDETARKIGAVNTVKIDNGKLCGFNTDAAGFIEPLKNAYGDLRRVKVAVLGNGGAARAAIYALKNEVAIVTIFARNPEKAESLAEEFGIKLKELARTENRKPKTDFNDFDIVVNATPLGMKGALENETPAIAPQIERVKLVYDLIYNPFETKFIKEAGKANVPTIGGLAMLVAQGMKQFEIWTGKDAPMQEMSRAALERV
ncbi:MAG: shikimate dehydrogenase [Acidobacteriota bacterium]|nr:shikimate dehydrogenase [Acidobacteriota bacterium]